MLFTALAITIPCCIYIGYEWGKHDEREKWARFMHMCQCNAHRWVKHEE